MKLTPDEVRVMDEIVRLHQFDWHTNMEAAITVASVCLKTGISDAALLVHYWNMELFQLGLVEMEMLSVTGETVH